VGRLMSRYMLLIILAVVITGCQSNRPIVETAGASPITPLLAEGQKAYQAKQWEDAIVAYKKVLTVDENSLPALYKLGNIAFRQKKLSEARDYYEQVVEVKPRYSKAQYNLAVVNLTLAEKHFKFFTATAEVETDISQVSDLLGHIYQFSRGSATQSGSTSALDKLASKLKRNSQY